ncbi:hypothetical protein [Cellulomonas sp. URHB0016]
MSAEELPNPLLPSAYDVIWTVLVLFPLVGVAAAAITVAAVAVRRRRRTGAGTDVPHPGLAP